MTRTFKIFWKVAIIIAAVIAAILMSSVILLVLRAPIAKTFYTICFVPFTNLTRISEVLVRAIPLCIIGLGICVSSRCGITNIGAEGQMAMGVTCFTAVALAAPDLPRALLLPVALIAAVVGGGFWGFIPGYLRAKLNVSELLSTVMLNYIAAQFYSFCLRVPMMDPAEKAGGTGTPMSMRLSPNCYIGTFSPRYRVHYGIIIALVLAALIYILMWKTTMGFKMRAAGAQDRAAKYAGINVRFYLVASMIISGALAGLAGGVEIAGVHRRALEGVTNNYGFSGVVVALFGGLHPFGVVPASLFFALLIYGSTLCPRMVGVPANIVNVMEGIIILVIVTAQMVLANTYLQDRVWRKVSHRKGVAA